MTDLELWLICAGLIVTAWTFSHVWYYHQMSKELRKYSAYAAAHAEKAIEQYQTSAPLLNRRSTDK